MLLEKGGLGAAEMPGRLHARLLESWKMEQATCLVISQLWVLSVETGGLAQSEVGDSNIDLFIYYLSSHLTPRKTKPDY